MNFLKGTIDRLMNAGFPIGAWPLFHPKRIIADHFTEAEALHNMRVAIGAVESVFDGIEEAL